MRPREAELENFEQFIIQKFGGGIANHFMLPYNQKTWARVLTQISTEWTSERVAAPKSARPWSGPSKTG